MKLTLTILAGICFQFWIKTDTWTTHALTVTPKTTEIPNESPSSTTLPSTGVRCYSCSSQVACSENDITIIQCNPQDLCFTRNIIIVYSFGEQQLPPHTDVFKGCFDRTQISNISGCIDGNDYLDQVRLSSPGVNVVRADGEVCFCDIDLCNDEPVLRTSPQPNGGSKEFNETHSTETSTTVNKAEYTDQSEAPTFSISATVEQTPFEGTMLTSEVLTESSRATFKTDQSDVLSTSSAISTESDKRLSTNPEVLHSMPEGLDTTPVLSTLNDFQEILESTKKLEYMDSSAVEITSPPTETTNLKTFVSTAFATSFDTDQSMSTTAADFNKPISEIFSTSPRSLTSMETGPSATQEMLNTTPEVLTTTPKVLNTSPRVVSTSSKYPEMLGSNAATVSTTATTNKIGYTDSSDTLCIIPPLDDVALMVNTEMTNVPNGTFIEYSCQDGFVLMGNPTTLCLNGRWVLPEVPTCEAKSCNKPVIQDERLIAIPEATEYKNGTTIEYECDEGHILTGSSTSLCLYGLWHPSVAVECEEFETFEEILVNASKIFSKDNVTSEDIAGAAQIVQMASKDTDFLKEDTKRVMLLITTLEDIVESEDPSTEVTDPVVQTINTFLDDDDEDGYDLDIMEKGRVVAALEKQISNVQTKEGNYTRTFENIGVSALKIDTNRIRHNIVFAYLFEDGRKSMVGDDLRGKTPQLFVDDETVPQNDVLVSISLPTSVLQSQNGEANSTEVPVSFIVYSNSKLFTPSETLKPEEDEDPENSNVTERIASQIISPKVENNENLMEQFPSQSSVIAKFFTDLNINGTRECVSWSYDERTGEGHWSKEGCTKMEDEGALTVCSCKQLASFAVLVRGRGTYVASVPLYYITLLGSIISCACLLLCIITFLSIEKLRSKQPTHIHINLCLSLLGFYIAFLLSTVAFNEPVFCAISSAVTHFFALATVAWMSAEAVNMYFMFVKTHKTRFRYFIPVACALAYGCPGLCAVLVAVLDQTSNYDTGAYCFIHPGPAFYFGFLAEVAVLFVFNVVLFFWVIRKVLCRPLLVSRTQEGARRKEIITRVRHGILFWFVLGLSWIFGFAAAVDTKTQIFQYLYCICIALQGVVMFLLLCVANPEFRKSLRKLTALEKVDRSTSNLSTKEVSAPSSSKVTSVSESESQAIA